MVLTKHLIKVVNKSRFILNSFDYSLYYSVDGGDGIREVKEIPPIKPKLSFMNKYVSKGFQDYALRISYNIDPDLYNADNVSLEFNIVAYHSLSGTMICKKQIYTKSQIKQGIFETGKSMRIIVSRKVQNSNSSQPVKTGATI